MKYRTLVELYLTFLTHNDSYMKKVPVGTVLSLQQGDLCMDDRPSTDDHLALLEHKFMEEI